jgi:hypothetical protein
LRTSGGNFTNIKKCFTNTKKSFTNTKKSFTNIKKSFTELKKRRQFYRPGLRSWRLS